MDEKIEGRMRAVCRLIDTFNDWLGGYVFALLALPLLYVVAYEVISRYVFDAPTDWSYELSYMLYGSFFMLGAGYTLLKGGHVRTDIFYNNWSFRTRGILDSLLYVIAFYPGMIFFFWIGLEEAHHAFITNEHSDATPWMPPLSPFKSTIPIAAALLLLQGFSELLKSIYAAVTNQPLLTGREA
ncbi:MAG: TRAP transporter small permease subunit [Rickettsiales bacterium]